MLGNKELALLVSKLEIPLVTSDILNDEGALTSDVRYGLHEAISDMQPDTALLTIATSAKQIVTKYKDHCKNLNVLGIECDRIIEEYGEIWLKNAQDEQVDENVIFDVLINTAEDLEGIAELLEMNHSALSLENYEVAELSDILQIQAKAHGMIAKEFINTAERLIAEQEKELIAAPVYNDNVIAFPGLHA